MKTIALATLVLASMATLALSQDVSREWRPAVLTLWEPDADVLPEPFPSSPEALGDEEAAKAPSFSFGPMAGYLHVPGADRGTWFGGVQARLHFARILAVEASISFHQTGYEDGDVLVTQYPVQLTAFLFPFPDGAFRPYLLGGVGWYYTRTDFDGTLSTNSDTTDSIFGVHLGLGVELMLGSRSSLDLDVRYIFLNATNDQVKDLDFNYWQLTAGLNFYF